MKNKIKTQIIKIIKNKTQEYIQKKLIPPSLNKMFKWTKSITQKDDKKKIKKIIRKIRLSLPSISSQISDGRKTGKRKTGSIFKSPGNNKLTFLKKNIFFSAWVSCDLGFIKKNGKNYGAFFIAVQSLTGKVCLFFL